MHSLLAASTIVVLCLLTFVFSAENVRLPSQNALNTSAPNTSVPKDTRVDRCCLFWCICCFSLFSSRNVSREHARLFNFSSSSAGRLKPDIIRGKERRRGNLLTPAKPQTWTRCTCLSISDDRTAPSRPPYKVKLQKAGLGEKVSISSNASSAEVHSTS